MKVIRVIQSLVCLAIMGSVIMLAGRVEAQPRSFEIVAVKCNKATLGSESDEIYFKIAGTSAGKIINSPGKPHSIKQGETWKPNYVFGFNAVAELRLFEADLVGDDDLIGTIRIVPTTSSGTLLFSLNGDSSNYTVWLKVN